MGHVELSAELHDLQDIPPNSRPTATDNSSIAAPALPETADWPQSGSKCSTSSSAPIPPHAKCKAKASSVRSKAAFFEAMIASPPHASTESSSPPSSSSDAELLVLNRSLSSPARVCQAANGCVAGHELEMVDQGAQVFTELVTLNQLAHNATLSADLSTVPSGLLLGWQPNSDVAQAPESEAQLQDAEACTGSGSKASNCLLLWPKAAASGSSLPGTDPIVDNDEADGIELQEQGHAEVLEHALERLQAESAEKDKQGVAAASALACKTQECESLMRIVRELTENRSKLVCARTNLAEKLAEMQHEYMRLMRVADLSRVVSKENVAKTAKVVKTLKQVEDEAARQQHLIGYFKERNRNLKDENLELRERVCLLERLDLLSYSRDSVCMREFKLHALKETY